MAFDFQNMVDDSVVLIEQQGDDQIVLQDSTGREYLTMTTTGSTENHEPTVSALTQAYVQFSGQTFPYLLVDLMKQHEVMINPARPLVIYNSMELRLQRLQLESPGLTFSGATLTATGKKAQVGLNFDIHDGDTLIGSGSKNMLLGGLRAYDQSVMDELVSEYNTIKSTFEAA